LSVKRNEIEKMELHLKEEERAIVKAEKQIAEDSALFDQFLDATSKQSNEMQIK